MSALGSISTTRFYVGSAEYIIVIWMKFSSLDCLYCGLICRFKGLVLGTDTKCHWWLDSHLLSLDENKSSLVQYRQEKAYYKTDSSRSHLLAWNRYHEITQPFHLDSVKQPPSEFRPRGAWRDGDRYSKHLPGPANRLNIARIIRNW